MHPLYRLYRQAIVQDGFGLGFLTAADSRGRSDPRPTLQQSIDLRQDSIASLVSLPTGTEQSIVLGVNVPNVSAYGEGNRLGVEPFRVGGSTNPAGVFEAGMLRDRDRLGLGTPGVETADVRGKLAAVADVNFGVPFRASFAGTRASVVICETFLLGSGEGCFFNEDALPFISIPRTTEPDKHCLERGIAARSSRQCGIAAWQEDEMREVGARHAKRALLLEAEPTTLPELFAALCARGIAQDLKCNDIVRLRGGWFGRHASSSWLRRRLQRTLGSWSGSVRASRHATRRARHPASGDECGRGRWLPGDMGIAQRDDSAAQRAIGAARERDDRGHEAVRPPELDAVSLHEPPRSPGKPVAARVGDVRRQPPAAVLRRECVEAHGIW
jgi:hypothetical protein